MNYEIDITRRCNFHCPGCNHLCNVVSDQSSDMTQEDIESIVSQINELDRDPRRLIVVGGEPTLHPKCVDYCRYIKEHARGFSQLRLNTNFSNKEVVADIEALGYDVADYLGPRNAEAQMKAKFNTHYNILISPKEEGIPTVDPHSCFILSGIGGGGPCGICVHKYRGKLVWCYCPNATSIAKLLGREDEFLFPTLRDLFMSSIDKLCDEVCVHCMSIAKKQVLAKDSRGRVSKCFSVGLERFREYGRAIDPASVLPDEPEPTPEPDQGDAAHYDGSGKVRTPGMAGDLEAAFRSKFDHVMCLACPQGVDTRLPAMVKELTRVGAGDMVLPYLNIHNVFAHEELDRRRFANPGARRTNVKNCLFGHYGMVKFAYDAGFERVLFLEDDCRFAVPDAELLEFISSMPDGANAAVDYIGVKKPVLDKLFGSNHDMWAALPGGIFFDNLTCYMLNREGMRCVVTYFEKCGLDDYKWPVDAADRVWPHLTSTVKVYIPRTRFAVQAGGKSLINGAEV